MSIQLEIFKVYSLLSYVFWYSNFNENGYENKLRDKILTPKDPVLTIMKS